MSSVDEECFSRIGIPYANGMVSTRRGDTPVIRRPCNRMHRLQMIGVCEEQRSSGSIMNLNNLIFTSKSNTFPVMGPTHGILRSVRVIRHEFVPCSNLPYFHHMIIACRGYVFAIRRPLHIIHSIMMPTEDIESARRGGRSR